MNQENVRLLVAAGMGVLAGLVLGMYIWAGEERKVKLSNYVSSLSDIIRELEELDTEEAKDLKEKVKNIIESVEEVLKKEDG